jgi:hypothetical protein
MEMKIIIFLGLMAAALYVTIRKQTKLSFKEAMGRKGAIAITAEVLIVFYAILGLLVGTTSTRAMVSLKEKGGYTCHTYLTQVPVFVHEDGTATAYHGRVKPTPCVFGGYHPGSSGQVTVNTPIVVATPDPRSYAGVHERPLKENEDA